MAEQEKAGAERQRGGEREHSRGAAHREQERRRQRPEENADRVDQPAHEVGAGELQRGHAQDGQQGGVRRPEDRERRRREHCERVHRDDRRVGSEEQRRQGEGDGAHEARPEEHAIASQAVGKGRAQRSYKGGGRGPDERDEADGGGATVVEGDDAERDGEPPLAREGRAERQLRAPEVWAADGHGERAHGSASPVPEPDRHGRFDHPRPQRSSGGARAL